MSLKAKAVLIIAGLVIALIGINQVIMTQILLKSFAALEQHIMERNASRVENALSHELETMHIKASDWAFWDDTYAYVQDGNVAYEESNLSVDTLLLLQLDSMIFLNKSGEVVYGQQLANETELEALNQTTQSELLIPKITQLDSKDETKQGILVINEQPVLFVALPIINTAQDSPVVGTLIFTEHIDEQKLAKFSLLTQVDVTLFLAHAANLPSDVITAQNQIKHDRKNYVAPLGTDSVAAYILVEDINQQPAFVLRATTPRSAYLQGINTFRYLASILLASTVIMGLVTYVLFERFVLRRLTKFTKEVAKITSLASTSLQLEEKGSDEFSVFIRAINTMLRTIAKATEEEQKAEEVAKKHSAEKEKALSELAKKVEELERLNEVMVGRELKMVELKNKIASLEKKKK